MNFTDQLCRAIITRQSPLCVGLDPRLEQLPDALQEQVNNDAENNARLVKQFCCEVIDAVRDRVALVKPNAAFFEALGLPGLQALSEINGYAQRNELLVLLDGKRGDIGSTAAAYAHAYLSENNSWHANALTVNPYLGLDTIQPMMDAACKGGTGIFLLVKTSNPGSSDIQDLIDATSNSRVYELVASQVEQLNTSQTTEFGYGNCGAVVGATWPDQLASLRKKMPRAVFLIPGVGAQGGSVDDIRCAFDERGLGAIVNSSRGIIFAHQRGEYKQLSNWQDAVAAATDELNQELRGSLTY